MKKILLYLTLGLTACVETPNQQFERETKELNSVHGLEWDEFYVVAIDGCEYVVYHGVQKGGIIHKQNCKNHAH